jgi:hypothetical protein
MEGPQKPQGTPRRRPVSVIALNGQYVSKHSVSHYSIYIYVEFS